eukprot:1892006-Pleurochrysis_carterae.AAC.4
MRSARFCDACASARADSHGAATLEAATVEAEEVVAVEVAVVEGSEKAEGAEAMPLVAAPVLLFFRL